MAGEDGAHIRPRQRAERAEVAHGRELGAGEEGRPEEHAAGEVGDDAHEVDVLDRREAGVVARARDRAPIVAARPVHKPPRKVEPLPAEQLQEGREARAREALGGARLVGPARREPQLEREDADEIDEEFGAQVFGGDRARLELQRAAALGVGGDEAQHDVHSEDALQQVEVQVEVRALAEADAPRAAHHVGGAHREQDVSPEDAPPPRRHQNERALLLREGLRSRDDVVNVQKRGLCWQEGRALLHDR